MLYITTHPRIARNDVSGFVDQLIEIAILDRFVRSIHNDRTLRLAHRSEEDGGRSPVRKQNDVEDPRDERPDKSSKHVTDRPEITYMYSSKNT